MSKQNKTVAEHKTSLKSEANKTSDL